MTDAAKPGGGPRLAGRRIAITGGASGIGRATAALFVREGARVALLDRDPTLLGAAASATGAAAYPADVADPASVEAALAAAAGAMGGIDGVVNAAGILVTGPVEQVGAEAFRRVVEVNLTGTYVVARAALPYLRAGAARVASGATLVNIASGVGLLPTGPNGAAYAASKGGVVTLTRALAMEFAPAIRVNSVCPGAVETPMTEGAPRHPEVYALKRWAVPSEIAAGILFLTGPESSFMTGIALPIDGGRTFH